MNEIERNTREKEIREKECVQVRKKVSENKNKLQREITNNPKKIWKII